MTIPTSSTFPQSIDTNQNLYQVRDGLRVRLIEDYNPGDKSITVLADENTMRSFNATGIITLTEQCSDPEVRAISFYYGSRTLTTFDELEILPGFEDVSKPKNITSVTQNVMAVHHNSLKDAIIAIQEFAGIKGTTAIKPLEGTMEERINYLRKIALSPKAWFKVDKTVGLAPLQVTFTDQSFRLGTDGTSSNVEYLWDFGDNSGPSIIVDSLDLNDDGTYESAPLEATNVLVNDLDGGDIVKVYTKPGIYSVKLTVTNDFGSDTVIFDDLVNAKFAAPDYAVINIDGSGILTTGLPSGGPYLTQPPTIRTTTNSLIDVSIPSGINPVTEKTYKGETVDESNQPIDSVINYTWSFADDLTHRSSPSTKAAFGVGGIYDLILRCDTEFGSYRITQYQNCFDIVERVNVWLWLYNSNNSVSSYEFGLISETFKTNSFGDELNLNKNDSFLDEISNDSISQARELQQKREFNRNNGFATISSTPSGSGGLGLLYWASGRTAIENPSVERILTTKYNGFVGTYTTTENTVYRPWNWVGLNSESDLYFILGGITDPITPGTSPTNQTKNTFDLNTNSLSSNTLLISNYQNGANELLNNVVSFDEYGMPNEGHMSVYRSCWHNDSGYFLRNEGVGTFFRIKSFYKTTGTISEPFQNIRKLPDMLGPAKVEGQLVSLSTGVYFFNNSGAISAYNSASGIWATGGPGANSSAFRVLQDSTVLGFDDPSQTLLAVSDNETLVYLSFDYSPNAFIKFNETTTTFSSVSSRPIGNQWQMCIF